MAKIWRFNDTVDVNRDNNFVVNFTSNGINFTEMGFKISLSSVKDTMYYSGPTMFKDVYYGAWSGDTAIYRTVTFETAPSGELLTWLQANAVAQDQPAVTTTRVFYKGKKELTMAQFEALTSLDDAVDYDITDFPNGGITNAQMTAALGYSRLFGDGDVFVCLDSGTYTKGHTYQVKVTGGVKSWEDITPESTPSTGTNIQVTELPPASAENAGKIVQFITEKEEGEEPVQGHWYKCKPVAADEGRYEWVKQSVQDKDYIVSTSSIYSNNLENVGRMVYQGSGRKIYWLPNIALGELAQLVSYQGNITINYTINDDYYPDGITKAQEMTWNTDMNGWMAIDASGFYSIAKQAKMFGSETLTKPLYMAVYQGEDLTMAARKTTKITVTSITLANGTSITIPTGYGEAKFYNYSINAGYSSPIDFYSKFESGNLTDADIEAFRFMTVNQVDAIFDINHLMVETEGGLEPLKDYLGSLKTVVYDNTTLADHIDEILGYVNTENGGNLISIKAKIGNTAITGSRKVVTTTTSSGAISVESGEGTIINAGEMIMLTPGAIRNGAKGKKATFICANDTDNHSNTNVDISNLESTNKAVLSGIEFGYLNDNIVQIYYQNINILDAQLEHLVIDYFTI